MATGHDKKDSINSGSDECFEASFRKSLSITSDEYHEKCFTCSKDGKEVSALKFCLECGHYLCVTCLGQHNRFDLMKDHQILDVSMLDQEREKTTHVDIPTQKCGKHHGKVLDMYCKNCDEVCCGACVGLQHSTCNGIKYVPDLALAHASLEELQNVQRELGYLQLRLLKVKSKKTKAVEKLVTRKGEVLKQVKDIRTKINLHLDNLESKVIKNVNDLFSTAIDNTYDGIKKLEESIQSLKEQEHELERVKKIQNTSSIFVQTKEAGKYKRVSTEVVIGQERLKTKSFTFKPDLAIERLLKELNTFGELSMDSLLPTISQHECIPIKAKEDKCMCDISDFCLLSNGTALLTDHENKCLKRLDNKNRISERLQLSAKPYGICIIDDSTAAVTLHMVKKVQFVTTNTKMSLKSSFSVGDHCRGIAYCYSLLYVCCGGWKAENEGPGHVEVYNTAGTLMKSFDHHLSIPLHIIIRKQDSTEWLYIADSDNGLIMMTSKGYVVNIFTHKDMLNYTGVCLGPENQIFVTGLDSNNVAMLAEDGQYVRTILTKKEGLKEPQSLFYDKNTSKLYVMMVDNDTVKTFDIK